MASVGVWIGLFIVAIVAFWCQATVTEERLVPALTVISEIYKIPPDIAGATMMAAGGSSPELFSSIVALFITHSSLGLGTVVGSEIFNQCAICAGAVWSSKTGKLELNKAILIREVFFYALSIVLLYISVLNVITEDGEEVIYISIWQACLVFAGFLLYVAVCANFQWILKCFSGSSEDARPETESLLGAQEDTPLSRARRQQSIRLPEGMPFIHEKSIESEPSSNFEPADLVHFRRVSQEEIRRSSRLSQASTLENQIKALGSMTNSMRLSFIMHSEKPSQIYGLNDIEEDEATGTWSCFMWQRSYFYGQAYYSVNGWHLRWFTFHEKEVHSVPDKVNYERQTMVYPKFEDLEVDDRRLIIKIVNPAEDKRDFYLMAPSSEILDRVVEKMEKIILARDDDPIEGIDEEEEEDGDFDDHDGHEGLLDVPWGTSSFQLLVFFVLFPLRWLMHYTVPDVRVVDHHGNSKATLGNAFGSTFMCLVWLVGGSYAMVASLEALAALLDIPDTVVGVTVSAAGTSLPNYVASCVAAKRGFGNMAVSNVFGSNTFNILVALGLPWVFYTLIYGYYDGLEAEGILTDVFILVAYLLVFILLIFPFGFVIRKWHGYLFIVMYIIYLIYEIGGLYW